jgi:hypothetical protein
VRPRMCGGQECVVGVVGCKDSLDAKTRRGGRADDRGRRRRLQPDGPVRPAMNFDAQRQVGPSQWPKVVAGLEGRYISGLDETGLSELRMGAAGFRREEIDVDEAARAPWVAERDLGALHQHERSVAAIADPLEERPSGEHRECSHSRFDRQRLGDGLADLVAPERFEWSKSVRTRTFGRDARQDGVDGWPEVAAAVGCRIA